MIKKIFAVIISASVSLPVSAQTMLAKWRTSSRQLVLHVEMDPICDNDTARAVSVWNSLNGSFKWQFDKRSSLVVQRAAGDPEARTTVEIGATSSSTAAASTNVTYWEDGFRMLDADIAFNSNFYYFQNGDSPRMFCSVNGSPVHYAKYDYQSLLIHEVGHSVGFREDYNNPLCAMYYTITYGVSRRTLCTGERNEFLRYYTPA